MIDFSDVNQQLALFLLFLVVGCTTCGVAGHCNDSSVRGSWEVRKACVYKTGNPECKR